MKTAAAYLRVSTEEQDEYSLDSQLKLIRDYAAKNDMIVPDEFVFQDETSGRTARKRKDFQRMIGWAKDKDHPFEVILVWKFSRFARNQEESIVYKSMLARCGVDVISISEPLAEGPFGSLIERILEWMDEFYSIRLSGEVKRGMVEKVGRGEIVTPPAFGYDVDSGSRSYIPNRFAPLVPRIYADYLNGKGVNEITRDLNLEGVRTSRGNKMDNRAVLYILQNPVYIGKLRWSRNGRANYSRVALAERGENQSDSFLVDARHEHLVDDETWQAVQDKMARAERGRSKYQRRDQPVEWMLKGLVRCSSCGSTLIYTSLACPSMQCHKYSKGQCQVSHSLSIQKANRLVISYLEDCVARSEFPLAPQAVKHTDGPDYVRLIQVERVKLRRVQEAYESGVDSLQEYAAKKERLLAGIRDLESKAASSEEESRSKTLNPASFKKKVSDVLKIVKDPSATESAKGVALRSIISYIVYRKPEQTLEVYFYI